MVNLHYPPRPRKDNSGLLTLIDQKSPCLYLLFSKLGLPSDSPESESNLSWVDRFAVKTPLSAREYNPKQPYLSIFDEEVIDRNDVLFRQILSRSKYLVRLILGEVGVRDDIGLAELDKDLVLFALPNHSKQPIYQQSYHGCVNKRTRQLHLYGYHPERILRGGLSDELLQLADDSINTFCALTGIKTVRLKCLSTAEFRKARRTLMPDINQKRIDVVNWKLISGVKRISTPASNPAQTALAKWRTLPAQKRRQYPALHRGRETQRATNWAKLRQAVRDRTAAYRAGLQRDVEALAERKRKDPLAAIPEPVRKVRKQETKPRAKKVFGDKVCPECGDKFHDSPALQRHIQRHSESKPVGCRHRGCDKRFSNTTDMNNHYNRMHTTKMKVKCTKCAREFTTKSNMQRHRRDQHPIVPLPSN